MIRTTTHKPSIDNIRKTASAIAFVTAVMAGALFFKLISIADLAEPLHVMLLLATSIMFGTVGFGLLALGAYCRAWILQTVDARAR